MKTMSTTKSIFAILLSPVWVPLVFIFIFLFGIIWMIGSFLSCILVFPVYLLCDIQNVDHPKWVRTMHKYRMWHYDPVRDS